MGLGGGKTKGNKKEQLDFSERRRQVLEKEIRQSDDGDDGDDGGGWGRGGVSSVAGVLGLNFERYNTTALEPADNCDNCLDGFVLDSCASLPFPLNQCFSFILLV